MKTIQDEIDETVAKLNGLVQRQNSCPHEWNEPYQATRQDRRPVQENQPRGSDFFNPVTVGFEDVSVPVWRKRCRLCGKTLETEKTEPVVEVKGVRPIF